MSGRSTRSQTAAAKKPRLSEQVPTPMEEDDKDEEGGSGEEEGEGSEVQGDEEEGGDPGSDEEEEEEEEEEGAEGGDEDVQVVQTGGDVEEIVEDVEEEDDDEEEEEDDDEEEEGGDEEEDDDEEDEEEEVINVGSVGEIGEVMIEGETEGGLGLAPLGSPQPSTSTGGTTTTKKSGGSTKINVRSGVTMTVEDMVQNCVYYFLINQHKKIPLKRADLLKHAMNGQKKNFDEVMAKFENILEETFGMKIVGLEKGKSASFSSYIILSNFSADVSESVTVRNQESDTKRATLYLILCVIFMLNRSLDEETIWKIIDEMQFNKVVCKKREDLRKFLKIEYVTPMYLNMEELNMEDHLVYRYSWGPRSEKEFSKWALLKFVASQFAGRHPLDFTVQYNIVMESEKDLVEAELEKESGAVPDVHPSDGQNGSALVLPEAPAQANAPPDTFAIEGLPTDTEEINEEEEEEEEEDEDGGGKEEEDAEEEGGDEEEEEEEDEGAKEEEGKGSGEESEDGSEEEEEEEENEEEGDKEENNNNEEAKEKDSSAEEEEGSSSEEEEDGEGEEEPGGDDSGSGSA